MEISKKKLFFATLKTMISEHGFFIAIMLSVLIFAINKGANIVFYVFITIVYSIIFSYIIYNSKQVTKYSLTNKYYGDLLRETIDKIDEINKLIRDHQDVTVRKNLDSYIKRRKIEGCNCVRWKECPVLYQNIMQDILDNADQECTECYIFKLKMEVDVLNKKALQIVNKIDKIKNEAWKYL